MKEDGGKIEVETLSLKQLKTPIWEKPREVEVTRRKNE